ncbi:MAG: hypothetical protein ACLQBL_27580 [Polyangiaceae bacterium]
MKIAGEKLTRDELALALTIGFVLQAVVAIGLILVQGPTPAAIGIGLGAFALGGAKHFLFGRSRAAVPVGTVPSSSPALRFVLGVAQMLGALVAVSLLVREGLTSHVVAVVVGTSVVTAISVALYGGPRRTGR